MAIPHIIATVLAGLGHVELPGISAAERTCEGAKFHSPTPLRLHAVALSDGRVVMVCGSCRDNLAVLCLLEGLGSAVPGPWRRGFGNQLRALLNPKEDVDA